jgi:RimJ/RimL family protein N-acetyltransferase
MFADPDVVRYIGNGLPSTQQQSWSRILQYRCHWMLLGFGYWAIEDKATGAYAGAAGFSSSRRGIVPSMNDVPEAGWALTSAFFGKGLAEEAARLAHAWSDVHHASPRTVCLIHSGNHASIRIAEKLGYREYDRTMYEGQPTQLFERIRPT